MRVSVAAALGGGRCAVTRSLPAGDRAETRRGDTPTEVIAQELVPMRSIAALLTGALVLAGCAQSAGPGANPTQSPNGTISGTPVPTAATDPSAQPDPLPSDPTAADVDYRVT